MVHFDGGLIRAEILWDTVPDRGAYPFSIPAIASLDDLVLDAPVVFFIGENGSGKSTMLEAIAAAAGINPQGGTKNLRTQHSEPTESELASHLRLAFENRQRWGFFLRGESFFSTATAFQTLNESGWHERSHGEQFIEAALRKFQPGGLHLLDEPESALSVSGQLKLLRRIYDVVDCRGQFIIATHSPILTAYPDAIIYSFTENGIHRTAYDETAPVQLTRAFLDSPERMLNELLRDDD